MEDYEKDNQPRYVPRAASAGASSYPRPPSRASEFSGPWSWRVYFCCIGGAKALDKRKLFLLAGQIVRHSLRRKVGRVPSWSPVFLTGLSKVSLSIGNGRLNLVDDWLLEPNVHTNLNFNRKVFFTRQTINDLRDSGADPVAPLWASIQGGLSQKCRNGNSTVGSLGDFLFLGAHLELVNQLNGAEWFRQGNKEVPLHVPDSSGFSAGHPFRF